MRTSQLITHPFRKLGKRVIVRLRLFSILGISLLSTWGCSPSGASPKVVSASPQGAEAARLKEMGERLSASGQSVRAEQYFLASLEAGEPEKAILPALIDTCIQSGRLRSALDYVQRATKLDPHDERLRRLLASLYLSLGQIRAATDEVQQLSMNRELSPETILFVAEFFEHTLLESSAAMAFYRRYLASVSEGEAPAWVSFSLRRLEGEVELNLDRSSESIALAQEPLVLIAEPVASPAQGLESQDVR
jgi:tetratricopeptide (TPR) repeat protein